MKSSTIKDHPRDGEFIVGPTVGSRTTYLVYNGRAGADGAAARGARARGDLSGRAGSGRLSLGGEEALLAAGQGAYLGEGPDGTVTAVGGGDRCTTSAPAATSPAGTIIRPARIVRLATWSALRRVVAPVGIATLAASAAHLCPPGLTSKSCGSNVASIASSAADPRVCAIWAAPFS